jgi:hypothetical protein
MSLKLTVGASRKVGLPGYGSLGAACGVEVELDSGLLAADPDLFVQRVREAFEVCARSVGEELDRRLAADGVPDRADDRDGSGAPRGRPASCAQVRALRAIARRRTIDLDGLVGGRHGVEGPEALTSAEASRLIDELQ